jgi:hypothetical protein
MLDEWKEGQICGHAAKDLETIFNPEGQEGTRTKKRNSQRRVGEQEGSICNKQIERQ